MVMTEEKLSASIKGNRISRVYYLYGKEPFLVKTYVDKIIKKTVGDDPLDFNLIRVNGAPEIGIFNDYIDGLPVFADMKAVVINDIDAEKIDKKDFEAYIDAIRNIPETTVLIFNITGFQPDEQKAQTKELISAVSEAGTVCKLDGISPSKIAGLVVKKAGKAGIVISGEDAMFLSERVLCNMTLVSAETEKLINYVGTGGVITREVIESLVPKHLDTSVYELATAINSGKRSEAFRILDDLFAERTDPLHILNSLISAYLDFYRAKLGKITGALPSQVASQFGYAKNREGVVSRAMNSVSKLRVDYLRNTLYILSDADKRMKSSGLDVRTILEETITRLFEAGDKKYV